MHAGSAEQHYDVCLKQFHVENGHLGHDVAATEELRFNIAASHCPQIVHLVKLTACTDVRLQQ